MVTDTCTLSVLRRCRIEQETHHLHTWHRWPNRKNIFFFLLKHVHEWSNTYTNEHQEFWLTSVTHEIIDTLVTVSRLQGLALSWNDHTQDRCLYLQTYSIYSQLAQQTSKLQLVAILMTNRGNPGAAASRNADAHMLTASKTAVWRLSHAHSGMSQVVYCLDIICTVVVPSLHVKCSHAEAYHLSCAKSAHIKKITWSRKTELQTHFLDAFLYVRDIYDCRVHCCMQYAFDLLTSQLS